MKHAQDWENVAGIIPDTADTKLAARKRRPDDPSTAGKARGNQI
jgi:hypothetical protein